MPYIAIDLDAFEDADSVAGATGLPSPQVLGGLALTWRWCWRNKADRVTATQVGAFFRCAAPELPDALVAFGFLEGPAPYRVRGVQRYLRISRVRAEAGKARAAAATRDPATGQLLASTQPANAGEPTSAPPAPHQHPTSPSATSDERRATSDDKSFAAGAAGPVEAVVPCTCITTNDRAVCVGWCKQDGRERPKKPRQRAPAPARATNGAPELVLEPQTPHEPDRGRRALIEAAGRLFLGVRGASYSHPPRDFSALDRLRAKHSDEEILRRFGHGLRAKYGQRVSTIWELEQKWDANATPERGAEAPGPKSAWKPSGHCELCNAAPGEKHEEWCTVGRERTA